MSQENPREFFVGWTDFVSVVARQRPSQFSYVPKLWGGSRDLICNPCDLMHTPERTDFSEDIKSLNFN